MDERTLLKAQIAMLEQQLLRAKDALNLKIDKELSIRVNHQFGEKFATHLQDLRSLGKLIESGLPFTAGWSSFQETRRKCKPLFEECQALMEGALMRSSGVDEGLCQIADALLDDLDVRADAHWKRFTILAEKEFYGDMAQVIRLRFPEVSIWNLPVVAHEFGHFVGQQLLAGTHPFEDVQQSTEEDEEETKAWFYLHEHFADLFATHALGVAFAGTCMLLRFNPMDAYRDTPRHPSHAKRLYVIEKALQKMNLGPYQHFIEQLQATWQQSLRVAGQPEHLDSNEEEDLDTLLEQLYAIAGNKLKYIQYHNFLHADELAEENFSGNLLTKRDVVPIVEPGDQVADVLNAAWMRRIERKVEDNKQLAEIEARARQLCREILQHKGSSR